MPGGGHAGSERLTCPLALAPVTEPEVPQATTETEAESGPHSPAATHVRRPVHEQPSQEPGCDGVGVEVSPAAPDGASWRLPLAAADAAFTAQEVQPLGRSVEGMAEASAALSLIADPPSGACCSYVLTVARSALFTCVRPCAAPSYIAAERDVTIIIHTS